MPFDLVSSTFVGGEPLVGESGRLSVFKDSFKALEDAHVDPLGRLLIGWSVDSFEGVVVH